MSNNGWITDRLPTEADAVRGKVLTIWNGELVCWPWKHVSIGSPWQTLPEPYVKPKRWTAVWHDELYYWSVKSFGPEGPRTAANLHCLSSRDNHADAAQRIADIYNEVMP